MNISCVIYMPPIAMADIILKFGKYKDRTLGDLINIDPSYARWLSLQQQLIDEETKQFIDTRFVDCDGSYVLRWGKHKNKSIKSILDNDKKYFDWLDNSMWVQQNAKKLKEEIAALRFNGVLAASEFVKSKEFLDKMKLPLFNYLLPYWRKFRDDGYQIHSIPDSIKELNASYMEESDEFMNWFNSEYERVPGIEGKDVFIQLADVYTEFSESCYFQNLSKKEKRANNKKRFIEKVSSNLNLRMFYKADHYGKDDGGRRLHVRNVITNYRVTTK